MKPKKTAIEQYIETYCIDQRIRSRNTLYVSREIHEKINKIAQLLRKTHVTAASLVDTILKEHINLHSDMLNNEIERQRDEFIGRFKSKNSIQDNESPSI